MQCAVDASAIEIGTGKLRVECERAIIIIERPFFVPLLVKRQTAIMIGSVKRELILMAWS